MVERGGLLTTPTATDGTRGAELTPGPRSGQRGIDLVTKVALLPTPVAGDGKHGSPGQIQTSGAPMLTGAIMRTLPTPTATDAKSSGGADYPDCSHGTTLTDAVRAVATGTVDALLPTPVTIKAKIYKDRRPTLRGVAESAAEGHPLPPAPVAWAQTPHKTLLPTPVASAVTRYPNGSPTLAGMMTITDEEDLADAARRALRGVTRKTDDTRLVGMNLPTPRARDARGHDGTPQGGPSLPEVVERNFPTPRARDHKGADPNPRGVDLCQAVAEVAEANTTAPSA